MLRVLFSNIHNNIGQTHARALLVRNDQYGILYLFTNSYEYY